MPKTKSRLRGVGRRRMYHYPYFISTKMEGNLVLAMESAISDNVDGCRTRSDLITKAVTEWMKTHKRTIPPIEKGNLFHTKKKGGKTNNSANPIPAIQ